MFGWINDGLYSFLNWINGWFGGGPGYWGITIILFTIMIRLALTPLDIKSRAGMRKTTKLQPQLQALQKKYANDKDKLNAKTAELYKKAHVNPLSSCLPLLLTWPILIAVFGAMRTAANHALLGQVGQILAGNEPAMEPFLWIKNLFMPDNPFYTAYPNYDTLRMISENEWVDWFNGLKDLGGLQSFTAEWFDSLSADVLKNIPDSLKKALISGGATADCFRGSNLQPMVYLIVEKMKAFDFYATGIANIPGYTIPLVNWSVKGMYNGFLLLPILSAVSQIAMTKLMNGGAPQPQQAEGQPNTGKFMQWFFPLFSLWICIGYSAAFALYWVAGNLVSMGQTFAINKYLDRKEQMAAPVAGEGSVK